MMPPPPPAGYDRSAASGATLDDLDRSALDGFLARRVPSLYDQVPPEVLGARVGLLVQQSRQVVPSVAGLICFGTLPQLTRPEWGLAAVRVDGTTLADPIRQRADLEGPLPALLEQGLAFARQHAAVLRGDTPEYPEIAVREALVNALVHRDYRLGGRAALRLFDDRLEVWSPGAAVSQLALEEAARGGGISLPRNPVIAATARIFGLIEQIGRGMASIHASMAARTSQPPRFRTSNADFLAILPSPLATVGAVTQFADTGN